MQLWRAMQAHDPRNLPSLEQCPNQRQSGVADLWYERLNLQKNETSASEHLRNFQLIYFHTVIQQSPKA